MLVEFLMIFVTKQMRRLFADGDDVDVQRALEQAGGRDVIASIDWHRHRLQ